MAKVTIGPMRKPDLGFVRRGLSETNWQDIPGDQKAVLRREECDRRVFEDFGSQETGSTSSGCSSPGRTTGSPSAMSPSERR